MVTVTQSARHGDGLAGLLVAAPEVDPELVATAWRWLEEAGAEQTRADELHDAVAVAGILAEFHLDTESLCAALLHGP
ncbi:MAG TPA: hypothetical protein VIX81_12050, partial [Gammaproteobacteria bacterium]